MFPTWEIEAIIGLIPIHLHLDKICGCQQLRTVSLPSNHTVKALLNHHYSTTSSFPRKAILQIKTQGQKFHCRHK